MIEFKRLWDELSVYCLKNQNSKSSYYWFIYQLLTLLQSYPSGISKSVLLTECESNHRKLSKFGQDIEGDLKQILASVQISSQTVIFGHLTSIDEYRCRLTQQKTEITLILHKQIFDYVSYTSYKTGRNILDSCPCRLVNCRLLDSYELAILPTPHFCLLLHLNSDYHVKYFEDFILPHHVSFIRHLNYPQMEQSLIQFSDDTKLPNLECKVVVDEMNERNDSLIAQVISISDTFQHPTALSSSYQVVKLKIYLDFYLIYKSTMNTKSSLDRYQYIYMVLLG